MILGSRTSSRGIQGGKSRNTVSASTEPQFSVSPPVSNKSFQESLSSETMSWAGPRYTNASHYCELHYSDIMAHYMQKLDVVGISGWQPFLPVHHRTFQRLHHVVDSSLCLTSTLNNAAANKETLCSLQESHEEPFVSTLDEHRRASQH